MQLRGIISALLLSLALAATAGAQDAIMGSAKTIDLHNFKVGANPIYLLNEGIDKRLGVQIQGGYGFTSSLDAEAKLVLYDHFTYIGGFVEYWLLKNSPVDVSIGGGFHHTSLQDFGFSGFDVTAIVSDRIAPRLELYAGLDLAFEGSTDFNDSFTRVNLDPGIEYKINPSLHFLAEVGLKLNDDTFSYVSGGFAYFIGEHSEEPEPSHRHRR